MAKCKTKGKLKTADDAFHLLDLARTRSGPVLSHLLGLRGGDQAIVKDDALFELVTELTEKSARLREGLQAARQAAAQ